MLQILDFFLHLDKYLAEFIASYGMLTYVILFLIVFVETGFVLMPLLPGDSLLFAAGALSVTTELNVWIIIPLLIVAALLGDNLNYFVGKTFGEQIRKRKRILFFKQEHLQKTEAFYEKHGGKTVIIARFIPIVRTVAPFVAGAGAMQYGRYIVYCIVGAIIWVTSISLLGYFFGNLAFVKAHFEIVIFSIIGLSVLPIFFGWAKAKFSKN